MKEFYVDTSVMTDEELADLIHELNNELGKRCNRLALSNGLFKQMKSASLQVRSWSSAQQRVMKC